MIIDSSGDSGAEGVCQSAVRGILAFVLSVQSS